MNEEDEIESLLNQAHTVITGWAKEMRKGDFYEAGTLAIAAIRRNSANRYIAPPQRCLQTVHNIRLVLNGLRDISNLCVITSDTRWIENSLAVEEVWGLCQDSIERIDGFTGLNQEFKSFCHTFVRPALDQIKKRFGDGLYTSWEMTSESVICTICDQDIRGCNHIPGRWYAGRICMVRASGGTISHVALLDNPFDKRCRIWPWMKVNSSDAEDVIYDVPIYIVFDPLGNADGGSVYGPDYIKELIDSPRNKMTGKIAIEDDSKFRHLLR